MLQVAVLGPGDGMWGTELLGGALSFWLPSEPILGPSSLPSSWRVLFSLLSSAESTSGISAYYLIMYHQPGSD